MSTTDYLLNGALIAMVLLQVRGRRLGVRLLVLPPVVVVIVAAEYLRSVPTGHHNLLLVVLGAAVGLALGAGCGLATSVYRGRDGRVWAKAGPLAALLWVLGVGARLAFAVYATHGGEAAIGRFSAAHGITAGSAWVDALVLMALAEIVARTAIMGIRYLRCPAASRGETPTFRPAMMDVRGRWS